MKVYIGGCTCCRVVGDQVEIGQTFGVLLDKDSDIAITSLISECLQNFPITAGWRNHSAQVMEMPERTMKRVHELHIQQFHHRNPSQDSFTDSDFEAFSLDAEDNPA